MLSIPTSYQALEEFSYEDLIKVITTDSIQAREEILNFNIAELSKPMTNERVAYIFSLFHKLLFVRDQELIEKLLEFGLTQNELRWYIPLVELIEQFEIIENNRIELDRFGIILNVYGHLLSKFHKDCRLTTGDFVKWDGVKISTLTIYLKNLKLRREKNGGESPKIFKGDTDYWINKEINSKIVESKGLFNIDTAIKFSKGKTEKPLLKIMLEENFSYDRKKISHSKFLSIIYNLFRMIMLDKKMEDFDQINSNYKKGIKSNKKVVGYKVRDRFITDKSNKMKQFFYK